MASNNIPNEVNNEEVNGKMEDNDTNELDSITLHPLLNTWTLWFFENDRSQDWEKNQKNVNSVDTIEDFWRLYNNIKKSSELKHGCDYSFFKKGISPMWEDKANIHGGRWVLTLDRSQRNTDLDRVWLDTLLCLIGEAFENTKDICGAVVSVRTKSDKIGLWTADSDNSEAILEIGKKLRDALLLPAKEKIIYQAHKDSMVKSSSTTKTYFTL